LKLKARAIRQTWDGLAKLLLPAILARSDDSFVMLGQVTADAVLIQDTLVNRPRSVKRAAFEANWTGTVLMARGASLSDLARRFDITWYLQTMDKYRRLLGEVLLASFCLQLFGLVTPLFFQVVTDKVLNHRGYTTLDVLVFGLVTVTVFETVLGGLRTHVFSRTTNRIDVELGARLFRRLIALPTAYFEARGAGDPVARELESIRTSSRARRWSAYCELCHCPGARISSAAVSTLLTSVHLSARADRCERVVYSPLDALPYWGTGPRTASVMK
jgi:subfamily B ATP-binding cassette protein HlyB/CyaB